MMPKTFALRPPEVTMKDAPPRLTWGEAAAWADGWNAARRWLDERQAEADKAAPKPDRRFVNRDEDED